MKVQCRLCAASILPETAAWNDELCAQCVIDGAPISPIAAFVPDRVRRFGRRNPEVMNCPFWYYMIGSGDSAYNAYDKVFVSRPKNDAREHPVWSFRRFGQSRTEVPGRGITVCIGGEHEDFYDEDFCIYNDVVVFDPSGGNTIYGYPRDDFAPTDFHSATLIGDSIWIIGGVGYPQDRKPDRTPVYRLDLDSMQMRYIRTCDEKPGWIWEHSARHDVETETIVVWGGKRFLSNEASESLKGEFALDLATNRWSKIA